MNRKTINYRLVARVTGVLLVWLAAGMVLPVGVTVFVGVSGGWPMAVGQMCAMVVAGVLILVMGLLLKNFVGRGAEYEIFVRQGFWRFGIFWLRLVG